MSQRNLISRGSTLCVEQNGINKQISTPGNVAGALYGYLVTNGGYSPGSGDVFRIKLHGVGF